MAIELGAAYISILPSTAKLAPAIRQEIRKVEGEAARGGERAGDSYGSRFSAALGRWTKRGLLAGAAGVSLLGAAGVKTAADLEQSQIGFETMLGSAEKANTFLAQIKKTAAQTPFELPGLTQASQRLLAFGFEAKDVIPTLTTLGDAASGLGLGAEGLDRIVTAVGQIQAKGKVQGEELLQLTEAGIPAQRILRNELGLTADEFETMQRKGQITADKAIPALMRGIKDGTSGMAGETAKFGGLMEKQSQSLTGLFSTLKDTVLVGTADAIRPLMPMLKDGLSGAIEFLGPALASAGAGLATFVSGMQDGTGAGGIFADVVTALWDVLKGAASVGASVVGWLADHKGVVVTLTVAYGALRLAMIAHTVAQKAAAAGGFVAMLTKWASGIRIVTFAQKAWTAAVWLTNIALRANPIGIIITALTLLGAGLALAWAKSETFRAIVTGAFNGVRTAASAVFNWLKSAVSSAIGFVRNNWKLLVAILGGPLGAAAVLIASNFGKIKSTITSAINGAVKIVKGFPGKIRDLASDFLSAGKHIGSKVMSGLGSGLKSATGFVGDLAGSIKRAVNSALRLPVTIKGPGPLPDFSIPAFAKGTNFAPGGVALVGEEGPELVNLPRGSQVKTASDTARLARDLRASAPAPSAVSPAANHLASLPSTLRITHLDPLLRWIEVAVEEGIDGLVAHSEQIGMNHV